MISNEEIAQYYDECEFQYRLHWNLDQSLAMHYGYWDSSTTNFHEALVNINKILARRADIKPTDLVLDAGCGVGGSAIYLAQTFGCNVIGITLSEKQVKTARNNACYYKVDNLAQFEKKDFIDTGFKGESFHVVWAIESVCHANDKKIFLQETYRVLRKNGVLIMADFFKVDLINQMKDENILEKWTHAWAIPDFSTIETFHHDMESIGFKNIQITDATHNIAPSARRLYLRFLGGIWGGMLYQFLGRSDRMINNNVWSAYLQYKAFRRNLWKYKIVFAQK